MNWDRNVNVAICRSSELFNSTIENNVKCSQYVSRRCSFGAIKYKEMHDKVINSPMCRNIEYLINERECIALIPSFPKDDNEINMFVIMVQDRGECNYKLIHYFHTCYTD